MSALKTLLAAASVAVLAASPVFAAEMTNNTTNNTAVKSTKTTKSTKSKKSSHKHKHHTMEQRAPMPTAEAPVRPTVEPSAGPGNLNIKDKKPYDVPSYNEESSHTRY